MGQLDAALLHTSLSRRNPDVDTEDLAARIRSTLARAALIAPCLLTDSLGDGEQAAAAAILEDVVQRRLDIRGSRIVAGVATTRTRGDRSISTDGKGMAVALFLPEEITELQKLCQGSAASTPSTAGGLPLGSFPPAQKWPC